MSRRRWLRLALATALFALACERFRSVGQGVQVLEHLHCSYDVIAQSIQGPMPGETAHYFERALQPGLTGNLARWSEHRFPLRVSVARLPRPFQHRREEVMGLVREAVAEWTNPHGSSVPTFRFQQTSAAEVRIEWVPKLGSGNTLGELRYETTVFYRGFRPEAIRIPHGLLDEAPTVVAKLKRVLLHELGHALGIVGHSDDPNDIMYPAFEQMRASHVSERDRNTLRMIYACPHDGIWIPSGLGHGS